MISKIIREFLGLSLAKKWMLRNLLSVNPALWHLDMQDKKELGQFWHYYPQVKFIHK